MQLTFYFYTVTFKDFGLNEHLVEGLEAMGFETPTPVQQQAIPLVMQQRDLIACAQTGTGKTAAYLLPVLHAISQSQHTGINTLIIAPTRELAQQIDQQVEGLAYFSGATSIAIYGGSDGGSWDVQRKALQNGADIIIATPGRLLQHLSFEYANFSTLQHLILDEADKMLDMGFFDDIMKIINALPKQRQTLLFSATMPSKIKQLANTILNNPAFVEIAIARPADRILQAAYSIHDSDKLKMLYHILRQKEVSAVVFSSTKINAKNIERELQQKKFPARAIHSDLEQEERQQALLDFKNGKIKTLVATDILSRGIDIEGIDLVINYDVPHDAEDYVHRIGRTARAAASGVAITFISPKEQRKFAGIEKLIGKEVRKVPLPADIGESPLYEPFSKSSSGRGNQAYKPPQNRHKNRQNSSNPHKNTAAPNNGSSRNNEAADNKEKGNKPQHKRNFRPHFKDKNKPSDPDSTAK